MYHIPTYIDVFFAPVRDSELAQIAIVAVLLLIFFDWLLGSAAAIVQHKYSSSVARQGMAHKASEICFVLLGIVIDGALKGGLHLGIDSPVLLGCCSYIIVMEIASCLETIGKINPNLAHSPLFQALDSMQKHQDEKGDK